MALTSWNDILNKPKGVENVEELTLTVEQLSASVLSISEDLGEVAEDVQEIALTVDQLSASVLPMSANDPTTIKEKIDDIIDDFIYLDDTDFTWDSTNKRFGKSMTIESYKSIIVTATNGTAVMGAFYASQSNILYVCGYIPLLGTSIDDGYHFKILIIK